MKTKDEALKMAIVAMKSALSNQGTMLLSDPPQSAWKFYGCENKLKEAFEACKEALEQPAQEPVAWMPRVGQIEGIHKMTDGIPLYTHPAPSWQGLTDYEIWDIANFLGKNKEWDYPVMFAKTIEQALKEKNT